MHGNNSFQETLLDSDSNTSPKHSQQCQASLIHAKLQPALLVVVTYTFTHTYKTRTLYNYILVYILLYHILLYIILL